MEGRFVEVERPIIVNKDFFNHDTGGEINDFSTLTSIDIKKEKGSNLVVLEEIRERRTMLKNWIKEINKNIEELKENLEDIERTISSKTTIIALLGYIWNYYDSMDLFKAKLSLALQQCLKFYDRDFFDKKKLRVLEEAINSLDSNYSSKEEYLKYFKTLISVGFKPITI